MTKSYAEFLFKSYAFEEGASLLRLRYAFKDGPEFEETIEFPKSARKLSAHEGFALDRAFRLIFLLAGVSYYKAYVPQTLTCEAFPLDEFTAKFVQKVYKNGLGEFAFKNKVQVDPKFVAEALGTLHALPLNLPRRSLVPIGGGKDSIVTIECLKRAEEPITLIAAGAPSGLAEPIANTIKTANLPSLFIKRTISKNLIELNKQGALNGHVPITAILSAVVVASAILHGFDTIIYSNENSASTPNVKMGDLEVNHQYSKSLSFEKDFADFIFKTITPDLSYFSILRPLTEAEIARRFAPLEKYFPVFRSCNTAFRQDEKLRGKNWCCNCPKCRFVFLALAPFVAKEKLVAVFGANMFADRTQIEGYKELCGLSAFKPFECVGEIDESALLMQKLARMPGWQNEAVVSALAPSFANETKFDEKFTALFENKPEHRVPEKYLGFLNACRRA